MPPKYNPLFTPFTLNNGMEIKKMFSCCTDDSLSFGYLANAFLIHKMPRYEVLNA